MRRRVLGTSRLKVSALGLGTSNWGVQVDEDTAEHLLRVFLEAGGNLLDTADIYGAGLSETIIGRIIRHLDVRSDILIATKAGLTPAGPAHPPNASYGHLCHALDKSLRKLGVDYVDLWQVHEWDAAALLDDTLAALDWAISTGRARYTGVSNYTRSQTELTLRAQMDPRPAGIIALQTEYSLLARDSEKDLAALSDDRGLGVIAWGALGRGVLTGRYRSDARDPRSGTEFFETYISPRIGTRSDGVMTAVDQVAREIGCAPAAVAVAWVLRNPAVDVALVGASSAEQLSGSLVGGTVLLPDEAVRLLDELSQSTTHV